MYSSYQTSSSGANHSDSHHSMFTAFQPRMGSFIGPHHDLNQLNEMQSRWALLSEAAAKAVQTPHKIGQKSSTKPVLRPFAAASTSSIHNEQSVGHNSNDTLAHAGNHTDETEHIKSYNLVDTAKHTGFTTQGQSFQRNNIRVNKRRREKSPDPWEQIKIAPQVMPSNGPGYGTYTGAVYSNHSSWSSTATLVNAEWNSHEAAHTLVDNDPDAMDVD